MFRDLSQSLLRPTSYDSVGDSDAIGVGSSNESNVGGNSASKPKVGPSCRNTVGSESQNVGERQRIGVGVNHVCVSVEGQDAVD